MVNIAMSSVVKIVVCLFVVRHSLKEAATTKLSLYVVLGDHPQIALTFPWHFPLRC